MAFARLSRTSAAIGVAGFALGAASSSAAHRRSSAPNICGTYTLVEGVAGALSGTLTLCPDGSLSSHVVMQKSTGNEARSFSGFSGKWWLHNASQSFAAQYPPHNGDLVEFEIRAASDIATVGQNLVQRYRLSPDGTILTLSYIELSGGQSVVVNEARWLRCAL